MTESASRRIRAPSTTAVSSGWVRLRLSGTASDNVGVADTEAREQRHLLVGNVHLEGLEGDVPEEPVGHDHQLREFLLKSALEPATRSSSSSFAAFPLRRAEIVAAGWRLRRNVPFPGAPLHAAGPPAADS